MAQISSGKVLGATSVSAAGVASLPHSSGASTILAIIAVAAGILVFGTMITAKIVKRIYNKEELVFPQQ